MNSSEFDDWSREELLASFIKLAVEGRTAAIALENIKTQCINFNSDEFSNPPGLWSDGTGEVTAIKATVLEALVGRDLAVQTPWLVIGDHRYGAGQCAMLASASELWDASMLISSPGEASNFFLFDSKLDPKLARYFPFSNAPTIEDAILELVNRKYLPEAGLVSWKVAYGAASSYRNDWFTAFYEPYILAKSKAISCS